MIHRVFANQPSFHVIEFTSGLNVVLAERKDSASQKDTRNSLGKSTLIEIIDFCLGSRVTTGEGLCIETLQEWEFGVEITLSGNKVQATRTIKTPNRIIINGPTAGWNHQPEYDAKEGEHTFNLETWKALLGWALFGLMPVETPIRYKPSFRSLLSYFIRRGVDAYTDPFRHFRLQKPWDIQLHNAFLLGLNWENAAKWQDLRDQEDALKAMNKAIKTGVLEGVMGTVGELEAERVQLESSVERERKGLAGFRVHQQYETIQAEADRLTQEIHNFININIVERKKLRRYEESISTENPPDEIQLESVYKEAGLVFSDSIKKTLDDAKNFHRQLIENRRSFLESEVNRIRKQITDRDSLIKTLTEERANHLEILKTHGAFEEYSRLQEEHVVTKEKLEKVKSRISDIRNMSAKQRDIKVSCVELGKAAELDYEERRAL